MEFSKQEYWNGLPFPPPGDLPDPGIKPASPAVAGGFLPLNHLESPQLLLLLLKRLPAIQETWAQSLGHEDPLEKEMATHSSILAWRIPWMEEPGGLQSTESQRVGHDRVT